MHDGTVELGTYQKAEPSDQQKSAYTHMCIKKQTKYTCAYNFTEQKLYNIITCNQEYHNNYSTSYGLKLWTNNNREQLHKIG